ncbi:MAG: lipoyl(octanoyl) transferase LipB [Gammaproteobacteria bacterium]|nr:lipoyl(octanoyl) transferase LipB [Gammaproteobacteria bacterium]
MKLLIQQLGLRDYEPVWQAMQRFTDQRNAQTIDEVWLVQHPPVFTLGKAGRREHLLDTGDIPVVQVDRGGQVTHHAPGQLIAYLMLDINRLGIGVRELVTRLENAIIDVLSEYGISAASRRDAPGVYVDDKKIAALGLRVRRGYCFHGLALNVDMDLEPFARINPCGYEGLEITQIANLVDDVDFDVVARKLLSRLKQQLKYSELVEVESNDARAARK